MKNTFIPSYLLVSAIVLSSCFNKNEAITDKADSQIKPKMLFELVEMLKVDIIENKNIHIFYKEILNDSTWLITFRQNDIRGSEELGVCEFHILKDTKIFVYRGNACRIKLNDSLKCKPDDWPIQFDGIYFNVLVLERNRKMIYYKLVRNFNFDEEESDSTDLNLMKIE
jgi:hypothetical protein